MKIKTIITAIVVAGAATMITSCKKNDTGGKATIAAMVKHHDKIIPYATVYIKYGADELPGTNPSDYDANQVADKEGHTHFENMRYGKYYLYSVGYDSTISASVKGGVPLKIKWSDRKQEIEFKVPVVE